MFFSCSFFFPFATPCCCCLTHLQSQPRGGQILYQDWMLIVIDWDSNPVPLATHFHFFFFFFFFFVGFSSETMLYTIWLLYCKLEVALNVWNFQLDNSGPQQLLHTSPCMEGSVRGSGSVKHIKHGSNILNAHTALLRRIERRRQTTDLIIYFYAGRCTLEPPPFIHRGSLCVKWTQDLSLCKWFKWNRFFFLVVFLFFFLGLLGGCWKGRRWFSIPNAHTYVRTRKRIPLYSYRLTCSLEPKFRAPTDTIGDKALVRRFGLKGVEEKQKISRSRAFSFNFLSSHRRQNKKKLTQRKLWTFRNGRFSLCVCGTHFSTL